MVRGRQLVFSMAKVQASLLEECEIGVAMVAYLCDKSSSGFLESGIFAGNEALDCWPVGLATLE